MEPGLDDLALPLPLRQDVEMPLRRGLRRRCGGPRPGSLATGGRGGRAGGCGQPSEPCQAAESSGAALGGARRVGLHGQAVAGRCAH